MDRDFERAGRRSRAAPTSSMPSTRSTSPGTSPRRSARIRETLRPGGAAVFSECVRPFAGQPIYVEFVFNFLENFTGVATDAAHAPEPRLPDARELAAAPSKPRASRSRQILPDVEELARHYDAFFVAAVSARRPR